MKKILVIALSVCLAAVMLVGCTPAATPTPAPTPEPTPVATPEPTPEATPEPTPVPTPMPAGTFDAATGVYTTNNGKITVTAPTGWIYTDYSQATAETASFVKLDANNAPTALAVVSYIPMGGVFTLAVYKDAMLEAIFIPATSADAANIVEVDTTVAGKPAAAYEWDGTSAGLGAMAHFYATYIPVGTSVLCVVVQAPTATAADFKAIADAMVASVTVS